MAKNEKVPGTTEAKPNRAQRRHPERVERAEDTPLARDDQPVEHDVHDPRAKNSSRGKKTADKWNQ